MMKYSARENKIYKEYNLLKESGKNFPKSSMVTKMVDYK